MPVKAAHRGAITAPVDEMARDLQELLSLRVIASTTGVQSPKAVSRWLTGATPHPETLNKLRSLYRTVLILRDAYGPETIRAWLSGANPDLGDMTPLAALRAGRDVDVFHAAESFVE